MAVRTVLTYPDPVLKQVAAECPDLDREVMDVAQDLFETMRSHPRCVGLAAPQIGVAMRIIAVDVTGHPKAERSHGPLVIVNPVVLAADGSELAREGCLSLPDITANVVRATRIFVGGLTIDGREVKAETAGFEARALLHEIDHLDGILILDRVASASEVFPRKR